MRCALLAAAAGGAVVGAVQYPLGNNVCVTDCCTGSNCILTPHKYCFDSISQPGFDFIVSGTLTKALTNPQYSVSGKLLGVKVAENPSSGSACEPVEVSVEGGTLATIDIDFTNKGTQSCPFPAGPLVVPGSVSITINPPVGNFKEHVQVNTAAGETIVCLDVTVGGCSGGVSPPDCPKPGPTPPAPVPPAPVPPAPVPPSGPLYHCSAAQQCEAAAKGVDLATCQALCKPSPSPPAPSPPAPSPPAAQKYKCDDQQQCVANAAGSDLAICQAACSLSPPAPTPPAPAPPAPAPPAPTPPSPSQYRCDSATGQCVQAAGGIDQGACQQLCMKTTYKCNSATGKCAAEQGGTDKASCEAMCQPPQLYKCFNQQCVKADTGISIDVCQQACS